MINKEIGFAAIRRNDLLESQKEYIEVDSVSFSQPQVIDHCRELAKDNPEWDKKHPVVGIAMVSIIVEHIDRTPW